MRALASVGVALLPLPAGATLGIFEHGNGIKALGFGGVSYVGIEETTAISANPAATLALGARYDLGVDVLLVKARAQIVGNALGPDESFSSNGRHVFPIPQGGVAVPIADGWAFGATLFAAGLGPDYESGPYERFAQTPEQMRTAASAQNSLKITGLTLALAHRIAPGQSVGLGLNVQHQTLTVKGLSPFANFSESPDAFSDTGKHGAFGGSVTVGWSGTLAPWLDGGLSYRTKSWTQRIDGYRGLLPDHGRLDLPAIYGGGLIATVDARLKVALEFQRYEYTDTHAFGNPVDLLYQGKPLGSDNGPGFGWKNQHVGKLGLSYALLPTLTARAGFSYSNVVLRRSQTLFNLLAPGTPKYHYTIGLTAALDPASELSLFATLSQRNQVSGEHSIPPPLGGGEANIRFRGYNVGVSYGRRFGSAH